MALLKTNSNGHARHIDGRRVGLREKLIAQTLVGFCKSHPCMGARATAGKDNLFLSVHRDMSSVESAFNFLNDLEDYFQESDNLEPTQKSLAIAFAEEPISSQDEFAKKYWKFVQTLHDIDCLKWPWDQTVDYDPDSPDFELSLCGRAIFTTTLNPQNPRIARRFAFPVWIMNQSSQFEHLRRIGRFTGWQDSIRKADADMDPSGEPNPVLADHGVQSAALQLAGSAPDKIEFSVNLTPQDRETARKCIITDAQSQGCPKDIITAITLREAN